MFGKLGEVFTDYISVLPSRYLQRSTSGKCNLTGRIENSRIDDALVVDKAVLLTRVERLTKKDAAFHELVAKAESD